MHSDRIAKKWKSAEIMLFQAADFLDDPSLFVFEKIDLESYLLDSREVDIFNAMESLAMLGTSNSHKPSFWKRLKKVAIQINAIEQANKYEELFQTTFEKNV
ncbi:hypothetical protein P3633_08970 [Vibrio parahaemolyticus]|nr:hypothetical protein [Vibrio parahaemolyticus]MDF5313948.1 hypothetical protein [Vibrio parahaemolyticus]MDF5337938.1 hypothetical protein [Vibrio parahaemolyticus]MDF5348294.1 hypothetical protein [Vibrio parahaemolyticus]